MSNTPSSKSRNTTPCFDFAVLTNFSKLGKKRESRRKVFWKPNGQYLPLPPTPSHQTWEMIPGWQFHPLVQRRKWHNANFSFPWLPTALTGSTTHFDSRSFSVQHSIILPFYTPLDLLKSWRFKKFLSSWMKETLSPLSFAAPSPCLVGEPAFKLNDPYSKPVLWLNPYSKGMRTP